MNTGWSDKNRVSKIYSSMPENHHIACPYRKNPEAYCCCPIGFWHIAERNAAGAENHLQPEHFGVSEAMKVLPEIRERNERRKNEFLKSQLRDYTSAERKDMPVHAGCLLYFPDAIAAVARLSKKGNDKHNPGEPLHWSRGKSNDHAECVARHSLTPDAIDPEMQESHRVMTAWRALADLQLAEEKRLVAAGIMPLSGVTS